MSGNRRRPADTEYRGERMNHDEIAERQVVHEYLLGTLSPGDAERFEEHYLGCPECLAELEAAEGLHRGLRGIAAGEAARAGLLAGAAWLLRRRGAWLAAAAAVAAIVAAGFLWRETERLAGELERLREPSAGTVIAYLSPVRSTGDAPAPRIHLPPDGGGVVLALDLGAEAGALHRVALYRESEPEPLWTGDEVSAGESGELTLSLPAELLAPGLYRVQVSSPGGPPGPESAVAFPFDVVPAGAAS